MNNILVARYYIMALVCYDRYVAICQPSKYTTNRFLKHISMYMFSIFNFTLLVGAPPKISPKRCGLFTTVVTDPIA